MKADLTASMIEAFNRYAEFRDALDHQGYAGATSAQKRQYTRLMNAAMTAAKSGTGGATDPVFQKRWSALVDMYDDNRMPSDDVLLAALGPCGK
jgi:hypothetical protein